jgi:hypothetical protein
MLGVDSDYNTLNEEHWINAQPQIVPIFGTFYVENEPEEGFRVSFTKTKYGGLLPVGDGEFAFELFEILEDETVLVDTYYTDPNGIVTADDLPPGSYVFKEVPKLFWDEPYHGEDGDYNLLWGANYPGGKDGLYFDIVLVGNQCVVVWADYNGGGNPTVDNVVLCKHNAFWNNLDFYYGTNPHKAIPFKGGWIIDFDDLCNGYLVPTYQAATCGVAGYIWFECSECYITTNIQVADALEHNWVASGEIAYDENNIAVGEWYTCTFCGSGQFRYFE